MRALRYAEFGPISDVLRFEDVDSPSVADNGVVVRTRFVGINPLDWKLVEGQFKWLAKSRPPCGVGAEFSGEVLRVGTKVEFRPRWRSCRRLGQSVQRTAPGTRRGSRVARRPVRGDPARGALDIAAVVPVAGLSALQLCAMIGVESGQRVLVHGAAGGVGSFVVSMLRDRGATVVATGSARSQAYLRTLQPDAQVDYATAATTWTGPFDAVIDCASPARTGSAPGADAQWRALRRHAAVVSRGDR